MKVLFVTIAFLLALISACDRFSPQRNTMQFEIRDYQLEKGDSAPPSEYVTYKGRGTVLTPVVNDRPMLVFLTGKSSWDENENQYSVLIVKGTGVLRTHDFGKGAKTQNPPEYTWKMLGITTLDPATLTVTK